MKNINAYNSKTEILSASKRTMQDYRDIIDQMESEMKSIQKSNMINERMFLQSQQKEQQISVEYEKLSRQMNLVVGEKINNEKEFEMQKEQDDFRISQLQMSLNEVQTMCNMKCAELEQVTNTNESQSQLITKLEAGRDNWRSQYLEIREINKDLDQKRKALKKEHKA